MSSTELTFDMREIEFALNEWLQIEKLNDYKMYEDFDKETMNLLVKEGLNFAKEVVAPSRKESDQGCKMVDGQCVVPECIQEPYKQSYELGWASLNAKPEFGGQGAPFVVGMAVKEGMIGGNLGLTMYYGLTEGCAGLIEAFGSEKDVQKYVKRMITGEFTGTMCLSEPHAGSDVGAGSTVAEPVGDGRYKIKGTKCWISSGDNNLGSNVIHAVLARLKGAPSGTKGLSLFLVPKYNVADDGTVGESNDVTLAALEHKMGINCSATAVLNFGENDNCYGTLLGEENKGIQCMFKMMNEARMGCAAIAQGVASATYQNALSYAKERVQGPHINNMRDPNAPRVAIINHPDVRLMLANMKSRVEAMRALNYATSEIWDHTFCEETEEKRQEYEDFMAILTPMCKGWGTETGLQVAKDAIQILGGVGYTKDFPAEQLYRDLRISTIYEGTTGIQALDLVGRKMTMRNGELFMKLLGRFNDMVENNSEHKVLGKTVQTWGETCERMTDMAMGMQSMLEARGMEGAALYATPFLMFISGLTAGYFYLQQGLLAADKLEAIKAENKVEEANLTDFLKENTDARFYYNKVKSVQFFVNNVIPTWESAATPIQRRDYTVLDMML